MKLILRAQLYQLNNGLLRLRARETWFLGLIMVLLIGALQYGMTYLLGWQAAEADQNRLEARQQEAVALENELAELQRGLDDPEQDRLQQRIDQLEADIARTDQAIAAITENLVSPEDMVRVLRRLLEQQENLRLRSLETLPVTSARTEGASDLPETRVYRHALTMELEGSFNAVARYVRAVESSEWQIYWQGMDYEMDDYPRGRLRLTLYTLSNEEGWLDV